MALFTRTTEMDPGAHGVRCAWAKAVHHAVGISRQRNTGYRLSRVNIMAQGLSTPDPSLSPTHLSIMTGRATTTHYTHHQVSLMVLRTTLVLSLGLCIEPACEAGLSAGMWSERVPPQRRKRKKKGSYYTCAARHCAGLCRSGYCCSDKSRFCLLVILQGSAHTHIRWGHEFLYHTFKHSLLQLHDKIYRNV